MNPKPASPLTRIALPLLGTALILLLLQTLAPPTLGTVWAALRPAPVSPALAQALAAAPAGETVSFLVVLDAQIDPVALLAEQGLTNAPPADRGAALYAALTATARAEQAD